MSTVDKHLNICSRCSFDPSVGSTPNGDGRYFRSPQMTRLLHSNEPPRESELSHINARRAEDTRRLSFLDQKMSQAREALDLWSKEHEHLAQNLADATILAHPVRRLPADILCHIFLACRDDDHYVHLPANSDSLNIHTPPWTLVRVCSRWRTIGNSYPALWSSISIDVDKMFNPLRPSRLTFLLGVHIDLSRSVSMSVCFRSRKYTIPNDYPLLQVLLPSSWRWVRAGFAFNRETMSVLSPLRGSLQSLRMLFLEISQDVESDWTDPLHPLQCFEFAPQLRILRLWSVEEVDMFLLPWEQLSEYLWADRSLTCAIPDHMPILRRTPNLELCSLEVWGMDSSGDYENLQPLVLPRLTSLYLEDDEHQRGGAAALMRNIVVPALDNLDVATLSEEKAEDIDCILSLLDRSHCLLREFSPRLSSLSEGNLLRLLAGIPTITWLNIWDGGVAGFTDAVASALIFRPSQTNAPLLPVLEHLELQELTCDPNILVQMVESRFKPLFTTDNIDDSNRLHQSVAPIRHLEFKNFVDISLPLQSRLRECRVSLIMPKAD